MLLEKTLEENGTRRTAQLFSSLLLPLAKGKSSKK